MTTWWRLSCAGRTLDSIPGLCPLEASSTPPVVRADPVPGGATHSSTPLRIPVLTSVPCHLVFHFPSLLTAVSPKEKAAESLIRGTLGTALVVQWLSVRLPMQESQVQSPVRELRSHTEGQLRPGHQAYGALVLERRLPTPTCPTRAHTLQQEKPQRCEARAPQLESSPRSLQLEKAHTEQQRPRTAINKHSD